MNFSVFEKRILDKLIVPSMDYRDEARLKYGLYLILDSLKKGILIYSIAFYFGILIQTIIVHISFLFVRQVSYGWHSSTKIGCLIESFLCFAVGPYLLSSIEISNSIFYLLTIIILFLFNWIGPIGTKISKLSARKTQLLHSKLKKRIVLIILLVLIFPITYAKYVIAGVFIQLITLSIQKLKNGVIKYV